MKFLMSFFLLTNLSTTFASDIKVKVFDPESKKTVELELKAELVEIDPSERRVYGDLQLRSGDVGNRKPITIGNIPLSADYDTLRVLCNDLGYSNAGDRSIGGYKNISILQRMSEKSVAFNSDKGRFEIVSYKSHAASFSCCNEAKCGVGGE